MMATGTPYTDLGPAFYATRTDPAKQTQRLIAKLEALGHKVTLAPPPETPGSRTRLRCAPPGAAAPSAGASLVLGGASEPWPDGAGRGLVCCLAAPIVAGCGPAWPDACRRWLPDWLPDNSLASLMFEWSNPVSHTAHAGRPVTVSGS